MATRVRRLALDRRRQQASITPTLRIRGGWLALFLTLLLALPLGLWALWLVQQGVLSDVNAQFVTLARVATERGRLELLGFAYPPLPLALMALWPQPYTTAILGALATGALSFLLAKDAIERERPLLLVGLAALLLSPLALTLVTDRPDEALALWLLLLAWRRFIRWTVTGITAYGFEAGLILGLAIFTTPLALPLAIIFGAALPLYREQPLGAYLTGWLILIFPSLAGLLAWTYTSWLFTGEVLWLYQPADFIRELSLTQLLALSPLYLAAGLRLLWKIDLRLLVYTVPIVLIALGRYLGAYSPAFEITLLIMFALGAISRRLVLRGKVILVIGALLQLVVLWRALPWPQQLRSDGRIEQRIGRVLSRVPRDSVLSDDATAYRLLAWSDAQPFVLPHDPLYALALSAPERFVDYLLTCPGDSSLHLRYGNTPPPGFSHDWHYQGCSLYRRSGATPLTFNTPE